MKKEASGGYLPEFVYGAIDGVITTFAIVTGALGASLSSTVILILGFANLFGDGFSMAVSNYLATESEEELHSMRKRKYMYHVYEKNPKKTAIATFISFVIVGFIPLISFVLALYFPFIDESKYLFSIILTGLAFIIVGAVKGAMVGKSKIKSALETLIVGGIAAFIAFIVGYLLKSVIG